MEKSVESNSVSSNFECDLKKSRKKRKKKQKSNVRRSEESESDASCSSSEIQMKKSKKSHCKTIKYIVTEPQQLRVARGTFKNS